MPRVFLKALHTALLDQLGIICSFQLTLHKLVKTHVHLTIMVMMILETEKVAMMHDRGVLLVLGMIEFIEQQVSTNSLLQILRHSVALHVLNTLSKIRTNALGELHPVTLVNTQAQMIAPLVKTQMQKSQVVILVNALVFNNGIAPSIHLLM